MHTKILSAAPVGVDARLVQVEVDVTFGMVRFDIVGLPDAAIKESSKRICSAVKNSGFRFPAKKITVNLAPADLKKEGTLFDLPITIGVLHALNELDLSAQFREETLFIGELSLDGSIRGIHGALAVAYDAQKMGKKRLIVPQLNAQEAALIKDIEIIGVNHLTELVAYLRSELIIAPTRNSFEQYAQQNGASGLDFDQVKGQQQAKRALQIAAAGRHNILFIGPPGAGKTMLAKRLPSIMPPLTFDEVLETSKIYSISGKLDDQPLVVQRPFRNPHHTISQAGLIGGGSYPQPGEVSLAHNGILFLDELTEFHRDTLEVLRQPLENKVVNIARVQQSLSFPASFLLIAALNPCPCGYWGDKKRACHCTSQQIGRYLDKLSGPLLDRIDLQISVQSVEYDTIKAKNCAAQSSTELLTKINTALRTQQQRFGSENQWNAHMTADQIEQFCILTDPAEQLVKKAFEALNLSMRGYHKLLKVARTIADLEECEHIDVPHVREAVMYRSLDQNLERQRG
jgi:magnesium chelatase family protein